MSEQTTNLELPFLAAGQAQKHVTVNETLLRLDALTQICVESATLAVEPGAPADGARYILPAGKTGAAWDAMADGALAYYRDGAWEEIAPREGWLAFARDADLLYARDASAWALAHTFLGLGTAALVADATLAHLAGAETFTGAKSFSAGVSMSSTLQVANAMTGLRAEFGGGNANGYVLRVQHGASHHGIALGSRVSGSLRGFVQGIRNDGGDVRGIVLQPGGGGVYIGAAETEVYHAGAHALPATDNAYNLGAASFRFGTVYAATGAINTSDAREKTPPEPPPESAQRAALRALSSCGVFQWRDAVAQKGGAARLHVGVTAQAVRDAFAAEGEDPERWALFCRDVVDGDGAPIERLGVRTDQLLMLALSALLAR
jgi:hypothetical protein